MTDSTGETGVQTPLVDRSDFMPLRKGGYKLLRRVVIHHVEPESMNRSEALSTGKSAEYAN